MIRPVDKPWRKTRAAHLRVYPECRICGVVNRSNHVHHMVYRGRRGKSERPGDLVTLCHDHHNQLHRLHRGGKADVKATLAFIEQCQVDEPDLSWIV